MSAIPKESPIVPNRSFGLKRERNPLPDLPDQLDKALSQLSPLSTPSQKELGVKLKATRTSNANSARETVEGIMCGE
jgi:hypothetical protein